MHLKLVYICIFCAGIHPVLSQHTFETQLKIKRYYFQWGYNREFYTRSNVHIKMSNGNDFILKKAKAHDKPDFDAILEKPLEVSIPQYNYRLGFYLNRKRSKAIEINFDHIKYVLSDGQSVHATGIIQGKQIDENIILNNKENLHLEHTDGGNLLHIHYVHFNSLLSARSSGRAVFQNIWKAGAGINIPRTDFTWQGDRLNNNFHIAGYNVSGEAGMRFYPFKNLFFEGVGKIGFVNYLSALANTNTIKGNRLSQHFGYLEGILTLGYDF